MERRPLKREPSLRPLSSEHHQALLLAFQCKQVAGGRALAGAAPTPAAQAARVLAEYRSTLLPHFRAEEEVLGALLLAHWPERHPLLLQLVTDHLALHHLALRLEQATGPEQVESLAAFGARLEAHVRFEERELFPAAEQALTPAQKQRLEGELPGHLTAVAACALPEKP